MSVLIANAQDLNLLKNLQSALDAICIRDNNWLIQQKKIYGVSQWGGPFINFAETGVSATHDAVNALWTRIMYLQSYSALENAIAQHPFDGW